MPEGSDIVLDVQVQAAYLPSQGTLFLWRPEGEPLGTDKAELRISGASIPSLGRSVAITSAVEILREAETSWSPSLIGYSALVRFSRALLQRGSMRPSATGTPDAMTLAWRATLDADERALLTDLVATLPPAAFAGAMAEDSSWHLARCFVDAALDAFVRNASLTPALPLESWEGTVERRLIDRTSRPPSPSAAPRIRRLMLNWERAAHEREKPPARLVLTLNAPDRPGEKFPLSLAAEVRDPSAGLLGPLKAADLWRETPDAHRLTADLPALKADLRNLLHKAGGIFAPIEATLASGAPTATRLSAGEAWSLLVRHRSELEAAGCRLSIDAALENITDRFPKARVRLLRADNTSPESVTLAPRYSAVWEVVTSGSALSPEELRAAAKQEPLARVRGTWIPMTVEAGERLARVAERAPAVWTGPQALATALAGEVRMAGDLADAAVVLEAGLERLLVELREEVNVRPQSGELKATLRHYQERGVAWLLHRTRLGLGALLADDMGLGKTVQLIALLLLFRDGAIGGAETGPTLLVCPASLVGNWERELARFAPTLRIVRHHGADRVRDAGQLRAQSGPHDIVLTTYSLVRRDAELLAQIPWGTIVADEAQNLKNPGAAQARAVRSLPAHRRVALSGTPVENALTELWGLMEFLNPGLLGPLDRFRREIANPLERDRDSRALRILHASTSPFMLRRLKSDPTIAPELPEKETIRVFCSLTEEQARLYKGAVDESLAALDLVGGIERSGRVLKLLTGLKQICNHPAHYLDDTEGLAGRSGKLDRAAEMLEEIVASGERALVFTQYVEMGHRLCGYLKERLSVEVPFFHGGLTLPAREAMVKSFQDGADGPPILVLSLRAGGVGLNLTRASHVLHYDRWWNPAVEDQATDRAHRIGQTQRVQVHHLITIGTLEERIDRMLESKRGLADAVVTGGESWITQLSTDELRALVSLGSDAAVESLESLDG